MKMQNIKNRIKYFTGTLAVSGMLAIGGCDSNTTDQGDTDYVNEVEAAENELGPPTRDNASQDIDAETYDSEDGAGQPARIEGQEANPTEDTLNNQNQQRNSRDMQADTTAIDQ